KVIAGDDAREAVRAFAEPIPSLIVERSGSDGVVVTIDLDCGDCYQVEVLDSRRARVHGGRLLGVQYGLAQLLEDAGFRFLHPRRTHQPAELKLPAPRSGNILVPEKTLRGLHLHTLHPIEAYFDFWENGDGYQRVIDWLVKNRGNYLQWP